MDDLDKTLSEAESDAAELEALAQDLAREIAGLDEIERELDTFSQRLDAEANA